MGSKGAEIREIGEKEKNDSAKKKKNDRIANFDGYLQEYREDGRDGRKHM